MEYGVVIAWFLLWVAALPLAVQGVTFLYLVASIIVGSLLALLWVVIEDTVP